MKRQRNTWLFILLLLIGIVIGGFIGEFLAQYKYFSFLNYGKSFGIGLDRPFFLDLKIIQLSFALIFNINIASVLGIILAIIIYKRM